MRYTGIRAVHSPRPRHLCLTLLGVILIASSFALASPVSIPAENDEVKKLIKQAAKLARRGSIPEAETTLRRAVEIDSARTDSRLELANILIKQRKLREAYDLSFEIAVSQPTNSRAFAVLGATLLSSGKFPEARRILENALRLNKKEHLAWANLGMLEFYENNATKSLQALREAVHFQHEPDYLFSLGQVSARNERYKEAAAAYNEFLKVSNIADTERRARIKGLISFLRFLGDSGQLYADGGEQQTSVPFELIGDRPIINVRINGKPEPLRFVIDTGSGISVLSEDTAKRLKLGSVAKGGLARGVGGDGTFPIIYGFLRSIHIGDVTVRSVPVYLRKFHDQNSKIDGYIGLALISKYLATVDYGDQTFSLTRKDTDTREFRQETQVSLPLRLTSSGFLSGEVEVEGLEDPLSFIVDTGASVSVISERVASSEAISRFARKETMRVIGSAGVTDDAKTFSLPRVSFGQHSRHGIKAVALDLDLINEASGFEQAGILGGNFLKNYRLTFDFKNSKVIFVPIIGSGKE